MIQSDHWLERNDGGGGGTVNWSEALSWTCNLCHPTQQNAFSSCFNYPFKAKFSMLVAGRFVQSNVRWTGIRKSMNRFTNSLLNLAVLFFCRISYRTIIWNDDLLSCLQMRGEKEKYLQAYTTQPYTQWERSAIMQDEGFCYIRGERLLFEMHIPFCYSACLYFAYFAEKERIWRAGRKIVWREEAISPESGMSCCIIFSRSNSNGT